MVSVKISKSDKPGKKLKAVFTRDNNRTKTVHFGQAGADDFTITKDKEQRKRYRARHKKDLRTGDYMRPGYLSYNIMGRCIHTEMINMDSSCALITIINVCATMNYDR